MEERIDFINNRVNYLERFNDKLKTVYDDYSTVCSRSPRKPRPRSVSELKTLSRSNSDKAVPMLAAPTPDPPLNSIPLTPVFDIIEKALIVTTGIRPAFVQRLIWNVKDIVEVLKARNLKAKKKYGHGLSLEDPVLGLPAAADKLADAVFLLTKMKETKKKNLPLTDQQHADLEKVKGLHKYLATLIQEIK
jgi:hypothetical protein